jgi:hypothetical protein
MAFVGRAKLSFLTSLIPVAYVLTLRVYLLVALSYNWLVRPKNYKNWERMFMCQRCGALIEAQIGTQVNARGQHSHELADNEWESVTTTISGTTCQQSLLQTRKEASLFCLFWQISVEPL